MHEENFSAESVNPLNDLAGRFIRFHLRFKTHFQQATRSVIEPVGHYLKGLMQADPNKKNMERMEEKVPHADEQQLQHMLTDSPWDHRAVIDQVARARRRSRVMIAHSAVGVHRARAVNKKGPRVTDARPVRSYRSR
jgi:SRSO17 transposase